MNNLYLIKATNKDRSLIKLGYSSDIETRLLYYRYHNPFVEVIGTYYREDGKDFEKLVHKTFPSSYLNEWYDETYLTLLLNLLSNTVSIVQMEELTFDLTLIENRVYTNKELKKTIQKIYDKANRRRTAKASDITKLGYRVKRWSKLIDGKVVQLVEVLGLVDDEEVNS